MYVMKSLHKLRLFCFLMVLFLAHATVFASYLLVPMDEDSQKNHLKAYGITYQSLVQGRKVQWLLNYRGGSFLLEDHEAIRRECTIRGVSYEIISEAETIKILLNILLPHSF